MMSQRLLTKNQLELHTLPEALENSRKLESNSDEKMSVPSTRMSVLCEQAPFFFSPSLFPSLEQCLAHDKDQYIN